MHAQTPTAILHMRSLALPGSVLAEGEIIGAPVEPEDDEETGSHQSGRPSQLHASVSRFSRTSRGTSIYNNVVPGMPWLRARSSFGAWVIIQATIHERSTIRKVCWLALGVIMAALIIILLAIVTMESSHPRCTAHDQCKTGEWCAPTDTGNIEPGFCYDCYMSHKMFAGQSRPTMLVKLSSIDHEYLRDAVAWCNSTDVLSSRCDHLVSSHRSLAPSTLLVLVLVVAVVFMVALEDLDEALEEATLLRYYATHGQLAWPMLALSWIFVRIKQIALPVLLNSALVSLILSTPLTATNILLDGLAITFVSSVDNTIASAIFPKRLQTDIEEAFKVMASSDSLRTYHTSGLRFNRIYVFVLSISALTAIVFTEELMTTFGSYELEGYPLVCSNIVDVAVRMPIGIGLLASVLEPIFGQSIRPCFSNSRLLDSALMALWYFASLVIGMQSTSVLHNGDGIGI